MNKYNATNTYGGPTHPILEVTDTRKYVSDTFIQINFTIISLQFSLSWSTFAIFNFCGIT